MWIIWCLLAIILLFFVYGYSLNFFIKEECYNIQSDKIKKPFRAVFLSDLHTAQFGENNCKLIEKIKKINPDIVLITGDMVVKNGKNTERVYNLCEKLIAICPIYYSPGNHEIRLEQYEEFKQNLSALGVTYLENQSCYLDEYSICVNGLDLEENYYHKCWRKVDFSVHNMFEYLGKSQEDYFQILLAHNPEYMPVYHAWGADLTLSGHLHGGIAILPYLGGVISPSLRLFPKYDQGYRNEAEHHSIISRGLGLHHIKLRFFNVPELAVINFTCEK